MTDGGTWNDPDKRGNSLYAALKFAKFWKLDGIVCQVDALIGCTVAICEMFHSSGLKLITYGKANNQEDVFLLQKDAKFDAVILDDVKRISRILK